ncbi:MAG: GPW/gp25 family protein [Mycobacterium leprae]
MNPGRIYGRSMAFPPRVGDDGRIAWSEGPANIRESIQLILLTEPGERLLLPAFGAGLRSFLYEPNTVATRRLMEERIAGALLRWEPRIQVEEVSVAPDPTDPESAVAAIRYRLVADGSREQVTLTVSLTGGERGGAGGAESTQA